MTKPTSNGPFVQAALLCDLALEDKQGVLSAIRIVDRFFLPSTDTTGMGQGTPRALRTWLVVALKAGEAKGRHVVKLAVESPSGNRSPLPDADVLFEGPDRGVNLVMNLQLGIQEEGLYWIDIFLGEDRLTRIPLRVVFQRVGPLPGPAPGGA